MWDSLRDIAQRRQMTVNDLVTEIDMKRDTPGLTAAIRVYIVDFYRNAERNAQPAASPHRALPM